MPLPTLEELGLTAPDTAPALPSLSDLGLEAPPAPTVDPVDRDAAKDLHRSFRTVTDSAVAKGAAPPSLRPDFAPHLSLSAPRDYINTFTGGDLTFADNAISPAAEAAEMSRLLSGDSRLRDMLPSMDEDTRNRWMSQARTLAHLNLTPASPAEKLSAIRQAANDVNLGNNQDPAAITDLLTKLVDQPRRGTFGVRQNLTDDERRLYLSIGGDDMLRKVQDNIGTGAKPGPYVLNERRARLTATDLRPHGYSPQPSLTFHDLEPVSSTAREIVATQSALAAQAAQSVADRAFAAGGTGRAAVLDAVDPNLSGAGLTTSPVAAGRIAARGASELFGAVNTTFAGIPEATYETAKDVGRTVLGQTVSLGVAARDPGKLLSDLTTGKYRAEYDGNAFERLYRASNSASVMQLAMSDPDLGRHAAEAYDFVQNQFPHLSDEDRADLLESYFPASHLPRLLAEKKLRISSPDVLSSMDAILGPGAADPMELINTATMAGALGESLLRRTTPRAMKDPKTAGAFTNLEKYAAESNTHQPLAPQLRANLLDDVTRQVNKVADSDPGTAADFASRFRSVLKDEGVPLSPERKALALETLDRFEAASGKLRDAPLSAPAKLALRELPDYVVDLSLGDQQYALTGKHVYTGAAQSLLDVERALSAYEAQAASVGLVEAPRLGPRSQSHMAEIFRGVQESNLAEAELAARKSSILDTLSSVASRVEREAGEHAQQVEILRDAKGTAANEYHSSLVARATEALSLERDGGARKISNPSTKTPLYRRLTESLSTGDMAGLESVLRDGRNQFPLRKQALAELEELDTAAASETAAARAQAIKAAQSAPATQFYSAAGLRRLRRTNLEGFKALLKENAPESFGRISYEKIIDQLAGNTLRKPAAAAELSAAEAAALGTPGENLLRNDLLRQWAEENKSFMEAPLEREIPKAAKPKQELHDRLQAKIIEARDKGTVLKLTQDEQAWLNDNAAKLDKKPIRDQYPRGIAAVEADLAVATKKAAKHEAFTNALVALTKDVYSATTDRPQIKIPAPLRAEIEKLLGNTPALLDKRTLRLSPDLSTRALSSLEKFNEDLSQLTREQKLLKEGVIKANSMDYALMGTGNPKRFIYDLKEADASAKGFIQHEWARAEVLAKKYGKIPADRLDQIYRELKEGRPVDEIAVRESQEQRLSMLSTMLKEGIITPEHYANLVDAPYAHNVFDAADRSVLPDVSSHRLPPGYRQLSVKLDSFKRRIPEEGNFYVAHSAFEGEPSFKAGFNTVGEAQNWIEQHLPAGSEAAIHKTMSVVEKEARGLVADYAASHLHLVEGMALDIGRNRISRFWSQTPFVRRASDLEFEGATFSGDEARSTAVLPDGTQLHKWTAKGNPYLTDKYVHPEVLKWFSEYGDGYRIYKAMLGGIETALGEAKGTFVTNPIARKYAGFIGKVTDKVPGAAALGNTVGAAFSAAKIMASYSTIWSNWLQNLWNGTTVGLNPVSPRFLGQLKRGLGTVFSKNPMESPIYAELVKRDIIRHTSEDLWSAGPGAQHSKIVQQAIDRHSTLPGLQASYDAASTELVRAIDAGDVERAANIRDRQATLKEQIATAQSSATKDAFTALGRFFHKGLEEAHDLYRGKSHIMGQGWKIYNKLTGDSLQKVMLADELVNHRGLSWDEAARLISDHTQQLHKVPATIKGLGTQPFGALYTSYPADQFRQLANAARNPTIVFNYLRNMALLSGWNYASLAASGQDPEDYLNLSAYASGRERTAFTDAAALLSKVHIPLGKGSVYSLSTSPFLSGIFTPTSVTGRKLNEAVQREISSRFGTGPVAGGVGQVAGALIGAGSKSAGAGLVVGLTAPLITGENSHGDPVNSFSDYMKTVFDAFTPPPGTDNLSRLSRALDGSELNLKTGRSVSMAETLAGLIGARDELSSPQRFRTVQLANLKARDPDLRIVREAAEDELLVNEVSRGARLPDGSINREAFKQIVRDHIATHRPAHLTTTPGAPAANAEPTYSDLERTFKNASEPSSVLRTYRRTPLEDAVSIYAAWRSVDPNARTLDPDWHKKVWEILLDKTDRAIPLDDVLKVDARIKEAISSGRLPPDAAGTLRSLQSLIKVSQPRP